MGARSFAAVILLSGRMGWIVTVAYGSRLGGGWIRPLNSVRPLGPVLDAVTALVGAVGTDGAMIQDRLPLERISRFGLRVPYPSTRQHSPQRREWMRSSSGCFKQRKKRPTRLSGQKGPWNGTTPEPMARGTRSANVSSSASTRACHRLEARLDRGRRTSSGRAGNDRGGCRQKVKAAQAEKWAGRRTNVKVQ